MSTVTAAPRLSRRLFCALYEFCLLFAVTFAAGYVLLTLMQWQWPLDPVRHAVFQAYLLVVIGLYFTWFWRRSGQTLAMKTWHVRLVSGDGQPPRTGRAWARYALLWWGLVPAAIVGWTGHDDAAAATLLASIVLNWAWALFDRDRQFLQDRLAGTRLVTS